MAHDNVPLGEAMRGKKSDVLIETKHSSGKLCFVYGRVGYSGPAGEGAGRFWCFTAGFARLLGPVSRVVPREVCGPGYETETCDL